MKNNRAFTLIELLVVIAIIAILAAILFPVFAQAKTAAKKATAIAHTKQLVIGVQMYMNDSNDVFPMGSGACWWVPLDGGWTLDTQPYIKNLEILRDSMDPKSKATWPAWLQTHPNGINISFATNGYLANVTGEGWVLRGVMGMEQTRTQTCSDGGSVTGWMNRGVTSNSAVTNPSSTIAFAQRHGSQITFGSGLIITNNIDWDRLGWPQAIPDGSRSGNPYRVGINGRTFVINTNNRVGSVTAPFGGIAVFGMADGSAKAMDPIKSNPHLTQQPENNMWDAYR